MYIICSVFLCCLLGSGIEVKFVLGVEFKNVCAITGEMESFALCETLIDDTVIAGILLSVIEKSDVLLVLLRELLKCSLFRGIKDTVLSEVGFLLFLVVVVSWSYLGWDSKCFNVWSFKVSYFSVLFL